VFDLIFPGLDREKANSSRVPDEEDKADKQE
jgi:hypothetical protein